MQYLKQHPNLRNNLALGLLCLSLGACALPSISLFEAPSAGQVLSRGESATVHFFTNIPDFDTDIRLDAGARYELDVVLVSSWIDSYIEENENGEPIDETGFANSVMPVQWLGFSRRSRENNWFELMLYQSDCYRRSLRGVTDLVKDENSGSYQLTASCDGKLSMFVNDSRGFYGNNAGYANINLSRIN